MRSVGHKIFSTELQIFFSFFERIFLLFCGGGPPGGGGGAAGAKGPIV